MALTHTTAVRNGLADYVVDLIDGGTTNTEGSVEIATDGTFGTILATIPLNNPAFGAAAAGVATADVSPTPEDSAAANTGTAAFFRVVDRDETELFRGTVTGSGGGGDMEMSSTSITAGDAVRINSFTYTAAA